MGSHKYTTSASFLFYMLFHLGQLGQRVLGRQSAAGDGGAVRWGIAAPDGARHHEGCLRGRRHGGAVACCVVRLVVNKEMNYTFVVSMFLIGTASSPCVFLCACP